MQPLYNSWRIVGKELAIYLTVKSAMDNRDLRCGYFSEFNWLQLLAII